VGGTVVGDGSVRLNNLAPLDRAGPGDLSFLTNARYAGQFQASRAGAVFCTEQHQALQPGPVTRIVVKNPHHAMQALVRALFPAPPRPVGIDATAVIGAGAVLGKDVFLGPYVVVGPGARIGDRTVVMSHSVIGANVPVGEECTIHPHVVLYPRAVVGNRVIVHAGTCLAADGFGYIQGPAGHERVPHVGRTVIEDDVEIGANCTIDRGSISDTVVGAGSKLDNLVHLGHNVRIGKRCLIMAFVGIAGSTIVEDDVLLAGQTGVNGHVTIGAGARAAAQSGIIGSIKPGATVSGYPARDHREAMRSLAALQRLTPLARELERLVERGRREAE